MSCCVQGCVVIVDMGESQGVMLCSGGSHKVSCCVREGVVIVDRGESQGVMLCSGGRGDSGQGRITRYHIVFRGVDRGESQGIML